MSVVTINKFLQKLLSFVFAKYGEIKQFTVTIDNMFIQQRHIYSKPHVPV